MFKKIRKLFLVKNIYVANSDTFVMHINNVTKINSINYIHCEEI